MRHCEVCQKDVHNLSAMTKKEATSLLQKGERTCVRYQVDRTGKPVFKLPWAVALMTALLSSFGCRESTGEVAGGIPSQQNSNASSNNETVGKVAVPIEAIKAKVPPHNERVGDVMVVKPKK